MKIAVIGKPGSGKSSLAHVLHTRLDLPLYHLDQYFWKPGWQRPDREEFKKVHTMLCDQDRWIIEGMAIRLLEYRLSHADVIIFLDIPTYLCFFRVFKRAWLYYGKVYFSSAQGCPELGPDFRFLQYIWDFNREKKPIIQQLFVKYADQKKIYILKKSSEIAALWRELT